MTNKGFKLVAMVVITLGVSACGNLNNQNPNSLGMLNQGMFNQGMNVQPGGCVPIFQGGAIAFQTNDTQVSNWGFTVGSTGQGVPVGSGGMVPNAGVIGPNGAQGTLATLRTMDNSMLSVSTPYTQISGTFNQGGGSAPLAGSVIISPVIASQIAGIAAARGQWQGQNQFQNFNQFPQQGQFGANGQACVNGIAMRGNWVPGTAGNGVIQGAVIQMNTNLGPVVVRMFSGGQATVSAW